MALLVEALVEAMRSPTVVGLLNELVLFCAPVWAAVFVGLLVGWTWKPKWVVGFWGREVKVEVGGGGGGDSKDGSKFWNEKLGSSSSSSSSSSTSSSSVQDQGVELGAERDGIVMVKSENENEELVVTLEDFKQLNRLVEVKDGGPTWIQMMDRSLPTMEYQAWYRDPEMGPTQYRSRTVFEDVLPELVRDFFWDDEYRIKLKWDNMLLCHKTLKECSTTGTMLVHWVRKFPFFCSDREYIIGRRIWKLGNSYYCITKGVPYLSLPRRKSPRRVDLYYSSWCIRPVESTKRVGQFTACEVLLFHHEDMGIPWQIAKLGVRQGMWGTVRNIETGLRAYRMARLSSDTLSQCAVLASINTKITSDYLHDVDTKGNVLEIKDLQDDGPTGSNLSKFLLVGGAVLLACTLDRGLLSKTVIVGFTRKLAKIGGRL